MTAGAIIASRQNRYIRVFSQAGATSEATARTLDEVGCRDSLVRRQLVSKGVLVEVEPGRFFLDTETGAAFLARRRRVVLAALAIAAMVAALIVLMAKAALDLA